MPTPIQLPHHVHNVDLVSLVECPNTGILRTVIPDLNTSIPITAHYHIFLSTILDTLHSILVSPEHPLMLAVDIEGHDSAVQPPREYLHLVLESTIQHRYGVVVNASLTV